MTNAILTRPGDSLISPTTRRTSAWLPILEPHEREQLEELMFELAAELRPHAEGVADISLSPGVSGIALYYAYFLQLIPSPEYAALLREMLARMHDQFGRLASPWLYSGFTGVAWTLEHISGLDLQDIDPYEESGDLDDVLIDFISRKKNAHFDLISGVVGLGVYGISRRNQVAAKAIFQQAVDRLSRLAEFEDLGCCWRTAPRNLWGDDSARFPSGNRNLGLAHGVPGVIALLAKGISLGFGTETANALLARAVSWLIAQRQPGRYVSHFSNIAEVRLTSRIAWCYGDLGVAVSIVMAGNALRRQEWVDAGLEIIRAVKRRDRGTGLVSDATLCHGASGIAHIYNRVYQFSGQEEFKVSARGWLNDALGYRVPGEGIAGFRYFDQQRGWQSRSEFLIGAAGIGLALLAAIQPIRPDWDRLLLVDL